MPSTTTIGVQVRWMIRRDLAEVLAIEAAAWGSDAWDDKQFLLRLGERNCIGLVAEHGEKVVGFALHEIHKHKLHVADLAVHPEWRWKGVGRRLIDKLVSKLSVHRRNRITVDVHEQFLESHLWLRRMGFVARVRQERPEFYRFTLKPEVLPC